MVQYMTVVSPLLIYSRYCSLVLSHLFTNEISKRKQMISYMQLQLEITDSRWWPGFNWFSTNFSVQMPPAPHHLGWVGVAFAEDYVGVLVPHHSPRVACWFCGHRWLLVLSSPRILSRLRWGHSCQLGTQNGHNETPGRKMTTATWEVWRALFNTLRPRQKWHFQVHFH